MSEFYGTEILVRYHVGNRLLTREKSTSAIFTPPLLYGYLGTIYLWNVMLAEQPGVEVFYGVLTRQRN